MEKDVKLYVIEYQDYDGSGFWGGRHFWDLSSCKAYSTRKGATIAMKSIFRNRKCRYRKDCIEVVEISLKG